MVEIGIKRLVKDQSGAALLTVLTIGIVVILISAAIFSMTSQQTEIFSGKVDAKSATFLNEAVFYMVHYRISQAQGDLNDGTGQDGYANFDLPENRIDGGGNPLAVAYYEIISYQGSSGTRLLDVVDPSETTGFAGPIDVIGTVLITDTLSGTNAPLRDIQVDIESSNDVLLTLSQ
jgi:hypothetical protein